jgi:hypothetical protein
VTEHVGDDGERLLVVVNGGDDIVTALVSGPDVDLTVELAPWAVEVRMVPA